MGKIKFNDKWVHKNTLNYNDEIINIIDIDRICGVYQEEGKQILIAFDSGKLYFYDALTFKEFKKPLKLGPTKMYISFIGEPEIKMVNNRPYYIIWGNVNDFVIDLWNSEIVIMNEYSDADYLDDSMRIHEFIVDKEFLYLSRCNGIIEVWNILDKKIIATYTLDKNVDVFYSKFYKFDDILQIKSRENNTIYNFEAQTLKLINEIPIPAHKDKYGVRIGGDEELPVKLKDKWVILICQGGNDDDENRYYPSNNYMLDALNNEMIMELPGDGDPHNSAGAYAYIFDNKEGDPLLILSEFQGHSRAYVYNLNHIDEGFQYFKDYTERIDKEYLNEVTEKFRHLYTDCNYLNGDLLPFDLNGKPVVIEKCDGKVWSLETLEPITNVKLPEPIGNTIELSHLYPVDLPNGKQGFITNRGELWNPLGVKRDSLSVTFLEHATIDKQDVFVAYSSTKYLMLNDTQTGQEICRSPKLSCDVQQMQLTELDGEAVVVVCLENHVVEKYRLSNLEKIGTGFNLNVPSMDNMYIVPFEDKIQLFAKVECSKICTWDLKTGKPIHQPLEVYYREEDDEDGKYEKYVLDGSLDLEYRLFYVNKQPFLGVNINQCDNTFLWDLNKGEHKGELDLFDKKIRKYEDEDTFSYDIFDIYPVNIDGKDLYLTISTSGVLVFFDPKDLLRVGAIKTTGIFVETFKIISYKNEQMIVIKSGSTLYLYDLTTLRITKKFSFEQNIIAYTISGNTIIIAYGEQLAAYEMK